MDRLSSHSISNLLAALLIGCVVMGMQPQWHIMWLVIALGHGHFLAAYCYKVSRRQVSAAGLAGWLAAVAVAYAIWLHTQSLVVLGVVVTVYFVWHILADEQHLAGRPPSLLALLEMAPIVALYASMQYDLQAATNYTRLATWFAFVCLALYVVLSIARHYRLRRLSYVMWGVCGVLVVTWTQHRVLDEPVPYFALLGAIILWHYAHWYVELYYRLEQRASYVKICVLSNLAMVAGFAAFLYAPHSWLQYIFDLRFYALWVAIHITFSLRRRDLGFVTNIA